MTGSGTLADPYVIWDVNDLQDMNLDLTAYYELGQNIDASATVGWNGGLGFEPVGIGFPIEFTGHFDGKGFTISDLTINRPADVYIGLFGVIFGATVRNVRITGNITGSQQVGGLIGEVYTDAVIENCISDVAVTGINSVGGLIGYLQYKAISSINNNYAIGNVVGRDTVGGFIGYGFRSCVGLPITNCHAEGDVTGDTHCGGFAGSVYLLDFINCYSTGTVTGNEYCGGFCGYSDHSNMNICYATGNLTATGSINFIGGFCGVLDGGTFTSCYCTGNIAVTLATDIVWDVGGFSGFNWGSLESCYSRSNIVVVGGIFGADGIGGLVGDNIGSITQCYSANVITITAAYTNFTGGLTGYEDGIVNASFWDITTSGLSTSGGGQGKTTEEMNHLAIFAEAGWDFTSVWNISRVSTVKVGSITAGSAVLDGLLNLTIINDAYPFFRWQSVVELPCNCGFEWDETEAFGNFTPIDSKNTGEAFSKPISGLKPNTIYYCRARASESPGPIHGGTLIFTTLTGIEVETLPATNITENSARIWGRVRKVPIVAQAKFQWGGNINYGAETPWVPGLVSDDMFYHDLSNLAEGAAYHYRAMGMGGGAVVYGNDMTFTTRSPVGPVVLIQEELAHVLEVS